MTVQVTDEFAEFRAISDRLWQVPTGLPERHRFLFVVRQWWQAEPQPDRVVLLVQALNTFANERGRWGDYACYIGSPPKFADGYARARWVAQFGSKLTPDEIAGFDVLTVAPDGIRLEFRP
jgi:hypothetical protein